MSVSTLRFDGATPPAERMLEQWEQDVEALWRLRHHDEAQKLAATLDEVRKAFGDFLKWVPEAEASRITGKSARWFRERFDLLKERGLAARAEGRRYYRLTCLTPQWTLAEQQALLQAESAA